MMMADISRGVGGGVWAARERFVGGGGGGWAGRLSFCGGLRAVPLPLVLLLCSTAVWALFCFFGGWPWERSCYSVFAFSCGASRTYTALILLGNCWVQRER